MFIDGRVDGNDSSVRDYGKKSFMTLVPDPKGLGISFRLTRHSVIILATFSSAVMMTKYVIG